MSDQSPSRLATDREDLAENLRYIRQTLDRARPFTAVSGIGLILMGVTALLAAAIASFQASFSDWLSTWLLAALFACFLGASANYWKARLSDLPFLVGPMRQMAVCFAPPLVAGAVLTLAVVRVGCTDLLAGMWMLLYGTAVMAGGAFSVRPLPIMGACLMGLGVVACFTPQAAQNLLMAAGFGLAHIGFGAWIARRFGG